MLEPVTAKHELHELIEALPDAEVQWLLDFLNDRYDSDELTPDEEAAVAEGKAEIERGEFIWGEDLERELGL